ncbi:MAG TPA: zinc ribbon domain-containing protein [Thermoleophilaceae bacterium]
MEPTSTLEAPTTELTAPLATTNTDRCPNCGAHMAPDQRYCIQCGERRSGGGLRDALPRAQAAPAAAVPPRRAWLTPNSSLIAGIATLLLAMGVGVLIGRSGDNGGQASATPQVVTVSAGAGGTAAAGGATADTASTASTSSKTSSKKKSKSSKAKVSGASSIEATAKKNGVKLPPKIVKVGQKCAAGTKGCQGGKFTGNYFGGG